MPKKPYMKDENGHLTISNIVWFESLNNPVADALCEILTAIDQTLIEGGIASVLRPDEFTVMYSISKHIELQRLIDQANKTRIEMEHTPVEYTIKSTNE